eukprot:Amastigsp_a177856_39.p1 type:complete len:173 gc:universal Amastigsp_a177856_39:713-195(-)
MSTANGTGKQDREIAAPRCSRTASASSQIEHGGKRRSQAAAASSAGLPSRPAETRTLRPLAMLDCSPDRGTVRTGMLYARKPKERPATQHSHTHRHGSEHETRARCAGACSLSKAAWRFCSKRSDATLFAGQQTAWTAPRPRTRAGSAATDDAPEPVVRFAAFQEVTGRHDP